ncbi:MAG: hypothetical protein GQ570_11185 [Helicobacteraceae bacterium]|nr:hypothetical protein [Helicobacteraceae bacterium]
MSYKKQEMPFEAEFLKTVCLMVSNQEHISGYQIALKMGARTDKVYNYMKKMRSL